MATSDLARTAGEGSGETALRLLFVATSIFGRGKPLARLFPAWEAAFGNPSLDRTLRETSRLVRQGHPVDAYQAWEGSGIEGIGESFLTKWPSGGHALRLCGNQSML